MLPVSKIRVLAWLDGTPGHESQVRGMIACLDRDHEVLEILIPDPLPGETMLTARAVAAKSVGIKPSEKLMTDALGQEQWQAIKSFAPQLSVGAGTRGGLLSFLTARLTWCATVQAMTHSTLGTGYTLHVIPAHDNPRNADHTVITTTAPNPYLPQVAGLAAAKFRVEQKLSSDFSYWTLILGGPPSGDSGSDIDPDRVAAEAAFLLRKMEEAEQTAAARGEETKPLRLLCSTSRRTPEPAVDALAKQLQSDERCAFFQDYRTDDRRTAGALIGMAEQVFLTPDSISMISEALWAGRGVSLLPLVRDAQSQPVISSRKHRAFITKLMSDGPVRWFTPSWEPPLARTDMEYRHRDYLAIQTALRNVIRDALPPI